MRPVFAKGFFYSRLDRHSALTRHFASFLSGARRTTRRTNGFLNMLKVMKLKAKSLAEEADRQAEAGDWIEEPSKTPMADQIKSK